MSLYIWVENVEILNIFDVSINTVPKQNMKNTEGKKKIYKFLEQKLKVAVWNKLCSLLIGKRCLPLSYSKPVWSLFLLLTFYYSWYGTHEEVHQVPCRHKNSNWPHTNEYLNGCLSVSTSACLRGLLWIGIVWLFPLTVDGLVPITKQVSRPPKDCGKTLVDFTVINTSWSHCCFGQPWSWYITEAVFCMPRRYMSPVLGEVGRKHTHRLVNCNRHSLVLDWY